MAPSHGMDVHGYLYPGHGSVSSVVVSVANDSAHHNHTWQPLTLQGAGLFHVAMGAVLGIAAFGRTQEKLAGTANNAPAASGTPLPTPAPAPAVVSAPPVVTTPTAPAAVTTGFGGKKAPPEPAFPEI